MKKIIILLVLAVLSLGVMAQNKKPVSVTVDTVKGAETVYFNLYPSSGQLSSTNGTLVFQALATNIGGTTNERGYLEFSVDGTSFQRYANAAQDDFILLYASDTTKIANQGNEWTATTANSFGGAIIGSPWRYYRVAMVGEANDTTQYTVKYATTK